MTLVKFDPYVVETWLDHGLVVAVPERDESAAKAKPVGRLAKAFSVRSVLSSSVITVGMALTSLSFFATGSGVADAVQVMEPSGQYETEVGDVRPGKWADLVALLRKTPELPADDTSGDPKPLG